MSYFLPYAIIAGIVVVFFVVCHVLYSGGSSEKEGTKQHQPETDGAQAGLRRRRTEPQRRKMSKPGKIKRPVQEHTEPLPHLSTVTVRERKEDPHETAFVTTKGEAVRRNGHIVYKESPRRKQPREEDNLDITRVLSREEILAAMEKVDKKDAETYRQKTEAIRRERQEEEEKQRSAEASRIAGDQAVRDRKRQDALAQEAAEKKLAQKEKWADEVAQTEEKQPLLADMAAVVAADLAAKSDSEPVKTGPKGHGIVQAVMKETAKAAEQPVLQSEDTAVHTPTAAAVTEPEERRKQTAPVSAKPRESVPIKPAAPAPDQARTLSDETQIISPELVRRKMAEAQQRSQQPPAAPPVPDLDKTVRMDTLADDVAALSSESTVVMSPVRTRRPVQAVQEEPQKKQSPWGNDLPGSAAKAVPLAGAASRPSIWQEQEETNSPLVKQCAAHFLDQFGMVTPEMTAQAEYITAAAFQRLGCRDEGERKQALAPLVVQEALQNVQKAYAAHPQPYVASLALQAFSDIVQGSPISTRHLVAIDALKVMPYLSDSHYKILALLLLFLYSRNAHNVDKETFCQYIDRYVMPFMEGLPTERAYYQQLDYLHCTAFEDKETHFAEILADSYPLLFRYRGITEEELRKALKGQRIPAEYVVQSFNSPLVKLALVDEHGATRFFRLTGITDRSVQDHLLRLAKKRPASFAGEEALDVMEEISPVLADLGDIWDSTMLRVSTLSLLGLYLAQGYMKERVGEEFDLSRWFE